MEIREFLDSGGRSPFASWFDRLGPQAAAKVTVALARMEAGNLSNAKPVGEGVQEYRIAWGPGYRLYFGRDGDVLIILLCGGTKRRQQDDIAEARAHWADYRRRNRETG
ncbi:type II toxin-antitoxin system RelE/ParE family toxin [Methylorubrum thiocyanatum]|uniref:type II toxin-antitoxin system RelE/ParE family toxin n=1 Tax=Methylorubrum thiocyanatum TaxID=47958 RepID=UPI0035C8359E